MANLDILIRAIDQASGPLGKINREIGGLDNTAERTSRRFGGLTSVLGTGLKIAGGAAAVGVGALAFAMRDTIGLARTQIEVEKQLDAVLASTGGAAGLTAEQIKTMAAELQGMTNYGDEAILSGQNLLLTFTNIGGDVFPRATAAMLDMSTAMGQDMKSSAIQIGKALNDPIAGVSALTRVGVQFTEAQKEQIKAMTEAGDVAGAQTIILEELERQFGGSAAAIADPAKQLQNAWGDFKEELGRFVIPILNDLARRALPLVTDAIKWFGDVGVPMMTNFGNNIKRVVDFILPIFQGLRRTLDDDVTGRFAWMKQWIDTNLPLVQQLVERVVGSMKQFWEQHGETIKTLIDNTFGTLITIIDTALKTIAGVIQLALQLMNGDWEAAGGTLKTIIGTLWDGIKEIFRLQVDSIRTIFSNFDWSEIGRNLMDGIANGIRDGAGRIRDAAEDAARDALEAAKRWLGINSPSTVAASEIGAPFAEGIGVGVESEMSRMRGSLANGMSNMLSSFAAAPVAAAGGSSYNISVVMNGGGGYEAGRAAGRGIMDELRARGLR